MKEYIEREALMKQVRLMASRSSLGETKPDSLSGMEVVGLILEAPAADVVERKRGEWYWAQDGHCKCSMCGQYAVVNRVVVKTNFCPNCGADMRGEKHEAD